MDPGGTLNVATSIATFPSMWDIADHEFPESKEIEEKEEEMTKVGQTCKNSQICILSTGCTVLIY